MRGNDMRIKLDECIPNSVLEWILEHHEIETWKGALVVASAHQLRIRRPS